MGRTLREQTSRRQSEYVVMGEFSKKNRTRARLAADIRASLREALDHAAGQPTDARERHVTVREKRDSRLRRKQQPKQR
jgi:hypothetical protein